MSESADPKDSSGSFSNTSHRVPEGLASIPAGGPSLPVSQANPEGNRSPKRKKVRVGNQSSYRADPPELPFDYALARGFDAFEWFPDRRPTGQGWRVSDLDDARRRAIRQKAIDHGVMLSVHAELPADPLRESRDGGPDQGLRLAEAIGARLLNVHLARPQSIGRYVEAVAPLAWRCVGAGVRLAIENTPADGPDAFNELFDRLAGEGLPLGATGMCLDIGHATLFPETRNNFLAYVDRLAARVPIVHVHAHENYGDRDSHLPLFSGPSAEDPSGVVGLVCRLERRAFCGCVILEQWPDPPALLDRARDGLLRLFGTS